MYYKDLVTNDLLSKFKDAFFSNSSNVLAQNICATNDPFQIVLSRNRIQEQMTSYNCYSTRVITYKRVIWQFIIH